jgi:hypothetical protein
VEKKKFIGDRPACPEFEESEIIEIDDDSTLGQELPRLAASGDLTPEGLERLLLHQQFEKIDWKILPVDRYAKQLESSRYQERNDGISTLGAMIALGNPTAFQVLLGFFSSLPPPATIEEVHVKKKILQQLGYWKDGAAVAPFLIKELGRIPSNNTTRQWISEILRFLERCPLQVIENPLRRMLADKTFSSGFRRKVAKILSRSTNP